MTDNPPGLSAGHYQEVIKTALRDRSRHFWTLGQDKVKEFCSPPNVLLDEVAQAMREAAGIEAAMDLAEAFVAKYEAPYHKAVREFVGPFDFPRYRRWPVRQQQAYLATRERL